jgi:MFS superfamily sulfate permease-like transporter
MWRFRGTGLIGCLLTMAGVVGIGVMEGIGIGVLFSLLLVLKALAFPDTAVLGQIAPNEFRELRRYPEAKAIPGVIVYRFSSILFFANCGALRNQAEELIESSPDPLHGFVLDASAISEVDLAACEVLSDLHGEFRDRGIRLMIANLQGHVRERLVRGWEAAATEKDLFSTSVGAAVRDLRTQPLGTQDADH